MSLGPAIASYYAGVILTCIIGAFVAGGLVSWLVYFAAVWLWQHVRFV